MTCQQFLDMLEVGVPIDIVANIAREEDLARGTADCLAAAQAPPSVVANARTRELEHPAPASGPRRQVELDLGVRFLPSWAHTQDLYGDVALFVPIGPRWQLQVAVDATLPGNGPSAAIQTQAARWYDPEVLEDELPVVVRTYGGMVAGASWLVVEAPLADGLRLSASLDLNGGALVNATEIVSLDRASYEEWSGPMLAPVGNGGVGLRAQWKRVGVRLGGSAGVWYGYDEVLPMHFEEEGTRTVQALGSATLALALAL